MKISIKYFIDECLCYPFEQSCRYFCINNQKFYRDVKLAEKNGKHHKIKYLLPIVRINIIELMENYLKSLNIEKDEVMRSAKATEPDNVNWNENEAIAFDVAFRIFIDGRYFVKDGKEIDMVSDWYNYRNSVCLPIVKKWCMENGIKWYDNKFSHFFHKWHNPFVYEADETDIFEIIDYSGCYSFVEIPKALTNRGDA